ncbi:MAG TPA: DUF99 family protein [archaeon]|nr:DUF99 family protein [archaeon]
MRRIVSKLNPIRVAGVEDGSFHAEGFRHEKTLLIVILMKDMQLENFRSCTITVDGLDATDKLLRTLRGIHADVVMLSGVSFAGFNLVDPVKVNKKLGIPVIIVSRKKPDNVAVKNALMDHFKDWKRRWAIIEKLGPIYMVTSKSGELPIYIEVIGANLGWAKKITRRLSVISKVPEPVRIARLIAHGLT